MKKGVLLNGDMTSVIARMGHTDSLCIADAGLPIPNSTWRIDVAISEGVPSFMQVLESVTSELCVERVLLAEEIKTHNPAVHESVLAHLRALHPDIQVDYVSHEAFKAETRQAQAVVRSGECSPYANILLYSGVTF